MDRLTVLVAGSTPEERERLVEEIIEGLRTRQRTDYLSDLRLISTDDGLDGICLRSSTSHY